PSTPHGHRMLDQLQNEQVAWLTTIAADGTPQPRLVWFLWEDDTILVYSQPGTAKLAHIARNPRVALHFNSDAAGDHMSVITGTATIDGSAPRAVDHPAYIAKYRGGIAGLNSSPEQFSDSFSVPVRIQPERMRGF
ncbi:MAG TPA: TIGR03667 family PPOX class F420-dependent oxidoreductase, partial [Thermomicrobiales bacterium]|nr:TIGR03667 family PPOX class F420-dependent oxidoreductase [Thermomicrobiales bacterium]